METPELNRESDQLIPDAFSRRYQERAWKERKHDAEICPKYLYADISGRCLPLQCPKLQVVSLDDALFARQVSNYAQMFQIIWQFQDWC